MATLTQSTDPTQKAKVVESVRPVIDDFHHQDSVFGNSFQPKSHFIVHPDWISEGVDPPVSTPLNRPPWSWEQPRHRQNVQYPITYNTPQYKKEEKKAPALPYRPPKAVGFMPEYGMRPEGLDGTTGTLVTGSSEPTMPHQHATTMEMRERIQWHLHY